MESEVVAREALGAGPGFRVAHVAHHDELHPDTAARAPAGHGGVGRTESGEDDIAVLVMNHAP
jgi:hypothetical protein